RHGRMTIWLQRWVEAEIKPPLKPRFGFIHRHKMTTARWRTRSLAVQTPFFQCLSPAPTLQRAVRNLLSVLAVLDLCPSTNVTGSTWIRARFVFGVNRAKNL